MKKRILVVEDNRDMIAFLQMGLELLGYDVITAGDGLKAVEMAASEMPDLIIMDISLPKLDGLEAVSRIRKNSKTQSISILAATAWAMPGDRERCLEGGCDGYIAKPFTHHELDTAIMKLLKERRRPAGTKGRFATM